MPIAGVGWRRHYRSSSRRPLPMFGGLKSRGSRPARACSPWWAALASIVLLAGCSGNLPDLASAPTAPSQPSTNIGEGKVKAGLILPLSASGNAALAAQQAAQQALDEGAEIILGPLFALTVGPVGRAARGRGVPVIAFSTDANVAARGVYLLS